MAHGDNHGVVGIEVLGIELLAGVFDFGAACVAVLLLHLYEFVLHHFLAEFGVGKNLLQVGDGLLQFLVFCVQLVHAQTRELRQTHVDNGLALHLVEFEALLQVALCIGRSLRGTDDVHHFVDIVAGYDQAFQYVGTFLRLAQFVLGAADGHVVTVLHEILHAVLECEQTWTALDQGDAVH